MTIYYEFKKNDGSDEITITQLTPKRKDSSDHSLDRYYSAQAIENHQLPPQLQTILKKYGQGIKAAKPMLVSMGCLPMNWSGKVADAYLQGKVIIGNCLIPFPLIKTASNKQRFKAISGHTQSGSPKATNLYEPLRPQH